jgi:nucleoside-diphosphate-sugar epimerase
MKILITGGAGFIGSNLVDRLINQGNKVIVIDDLSTGKKENLNPEADFHQVSICDFEKIEPLFQGVDYVFHLAALPRVPVSVKDPVGTSQVNIMGTINVFKAASDNKVKRIIFASSSSVYGDQEKLPLREEMTCSPISPYALQKLAGEQWAKLFTDLYNLPIISLRFFNIYGPRNDPESDYSLVIAKFLKQKSEGRTLTIFGDGEQTRGFCYIDDLLDALLKAMTSEKLKGGEVMNIGSEKSHSVNYLAKLLSDKIEYLPPRKGDVLHTAADISLAKEFLDWEPEVSFEQGVEKTKQWFENSYGK